MKRSCYSVVGKSLGTLAVLALLWVMCPVVASIVSTVTGLCIIAFWGHKSRVPSTDLELNRLDFKMRLSLLEAEKSNKSVVVKSVEARNPRSPMIELLLGEILPATATISFFAILFHVMHLPKAVVMLLFVSILFLIARHRAMLGTLAASGIATMALSLLFLRPIGSIWVARPNDRLSLVFFIVISLVGSVWICRGRNRLAPIQSDTSLRS